MVITFEIYIASDTAMFSGNNFHQHVTAAHDVMEKNAGIPKELWPDRSKAMNVTIRKIGNSEGVILPKEVLERYNLKAGDQLVLIEDGNDLKLRRLEEDPQAFESKMKIARERMKKYETAYRVLAK